MISSIRRPIFGSGSTTSSSYSNNFPGMSRYTIASYNAGPIAVGSWIALHRGRSQDEFVELIPYQETRQYVKRVLRSYREYIRLDKAS